jgi:nitroreductase
MSYLLDANVFIEAKNRYYGFEICPAFWDWLIAKNAAGRVFSIEAVREELKAGEDQLAEWATDRGSGFFLRPDAGFPAASAEVSGWVDSQSYYQYAKHAFLQGADLYLVAQARALGYCVVTHEEANDSRKEVKIPEPCHALGIECISLFKLLQREGARFILAP